MPRMDKKMEAARGYWRGIMNSIKASRAWRAAGYELTKIKRREGIISLWSRQWKTGTLLSNLPGGVLAGVLRALDPYHAADGHNVRATGHERRRLPG